MRALLLTAMTILAGGPALASSIQPIVGLTQGDTPSIINLSCSDCPAPKSPEELSEYKVPTLPAGTQAVEVRDVDGHKELLRTEAWLGGSPVTFVSASPFWFQDRGVVVAGQPQPPVNDGVDAAATTAAVEPTAASPSPAPIAIAASAGGPQEPASLDTNGFELRLN